MGQLIYLKDVVTPLFERREVRRLRHVRGRVSSQRVQFEQRQSGHRGSRRVHGVRRVRHQLPDRGDCRTKRRRMRRRSDQRGSGAEQFFVLLCHRTQETRRPADGHSESEIRLLLTGSCSLLSCSASHEPQQFRTASASRHPRRTVRNPEILDISGPRAFAGDDDFLKDFVPSVHFVLVFLHRCKLADS